MSDMTIPISIPTDNDGYVTFQCPFCNNKFKLHADECQEDEVLEFFCPYCGLTDEPSAFLSDDVRQLAMDMAENMMIDMLNDFTKDMERTFRGNKIVKFKSNKIDKVPEKKLFEANSEEIITEMGCCKRHVKVPYTAKESGVLVCPYCGVR